MKKTNTHLCVWEFTQAAPLSYLKMFKNKELNSRWFKRLSARHQHQAAVEECAGRRSMYTMCVVSLPSIKNVFNEAPPPSTSFLGVRVLISHLPRPNL